MSAERLAYQQLLDAHWMQTSVSNLPSGTQCSCCILTPTMRTSVGSGPAQSLIVPRFAISTGRRRAQAKHILQLPDDPVILTHSCMTCTFQGVNTAHLYLMDQLSALISCSPPPTPLPMDRNRRADDLGALMLPSGSTGFSKAVCIPQR